MVKNNKLVRFGVGVYRRYSNEHVSSLGAELAYFFFLSLFPFLVFLLQIVAFMPIDKNIIFDYARDYVPESAMNLVEANVAQILDHQSGGLLSFGLVATLWIISRSSSALMRALNHAYVVKETRPYWKIVVTSFLLSISFVFVIVFTLLITIFGQRIIIFIFSLLHISYDQIHIWNVVQFGLSVGVMFVVFSFLYYVVPSIKMKVKDVYAGALFSTIGWITISYGFAYYVNNFSNYAVTYGSIGGIIVLMTWFYFSGIIIVVGGIINAELKHLRDEEIVK